MDINPSLVDATGREVYLVGGNQSWKQATFRGYNVSLEWFIGKRSFEPMMVIWPVRGERNTGCWGICLSSVPAYCEFNANDQATGTPTPYARIEAATVVHEMFDRAPIDAEVNNLLDVVMRFAPDLITQVPPPPAELLVSGRKPILEVVRKENGRAVAEVSL